MGICFELLRLNPFILGESLPSNTGDVSLEDDDFGRILELMEDALEDLGLVWLLLSVCCSARRPIVNPIMVAAGVSFLISTFLLCGGSIGVDSLLVRMCECCDDGGGWN